LEVRFGDMTLETFLENIPHLLAMAVLIGLSGSISASETALFALSRHQLNRLRQSNHALSQLVLRLRENPRTLLSTILLANIAVNTLLYSVLAVTSAKLAGGHPLWTTVFGVLGFAVVLIFGEIGPKLAAYGSSERLAPVVSVPISVLEAITLPLRWTLETLLVEPLTRILIGHEKRTAETAGEHGSIQAEDLQRLARMSQMEGLITEKEDVFFRRVMELRDLRVSGLMVPRVDVIAFNLAGSREELVELIKSSRLLRMPVYEGDIDNIRGVVLAKEVLLDSARPIRDLIRPVRFIPEQAGVEALLRHFRTTQSKLAVVVDEYGGIAGIVALEDVVEAIVGEFYAADEASAFPSVQRVDQITYLIDAGLQVDEFRRAFGLPIEETRINTVAGLIAERLDRIPQRGDEVAIGPARLTVVSMKNRRILQARLTLEKPPAETPELKMLMEPARLDAEKESAAGRRAGQ
jgi:CBS domain containing-hemolysin-like protein